MDYQYFTFFLTLISLLGCILRIFPSPLLIRWVFHYPMLQIDQSIVDPNGIIIRIIMLFYLAWCFLILICAWDHVCYNLIIWYKGGFKKWVDRNGYLQYLVKLGVFLLERYIGRGFINTILGNIFPIFSEITDIL